MRCCIISHRDRFSIYFVAFVKGKISQQNERFSLQPQYNHHIYRLKSNCITVRFCCKGRNNISQKTLDNLITAGLRNFTSKTWIRLITIFLIIL